MLKKFINVEYLVVCVTSLFMSNVYSYESLLEASVLTQTEYNDNIFLSSDNPEDRTSIVVAPSISAIIKEQNWQADLGARVKSYRYSEADLNNNEQFFDLTGRYNAERNIFSLNINHDLTSNLSYASADFGLVAQRVNTKKQSITPQYTYLMTERAALILSYTYTDVSYSEAGNLGYNPYVSETGSGSLIYNLTEKDKLTLSLFAVDYKSRDELVTYQLFMSRFGVDHEFSETLSVDFLVGVSRRYTTNLSTQEFDFFGSTVVKTQEIDYSDRGLVFDANVNLQLESGKIVINTSRDNNTNSFGGLDQVDKFKLRYEENLSSLWRYYMSVGYDDIISISSTSSTSDRNILFFEAKTVYSISQNWNVSASYRYTERKFKSNLSNSETPSSNKIYMSLSYNFPSLTTF